MAGEGVGFFDGEALLEHQLRGGEHDGYADAVGDEVGSVIGEDDLLAEEAIGEGGEGGKQPGVGFGDGDEFQEAHVAGRIEEVAAEEAGAHGFRECGGDEFDGQAGGVGGEQRLGLKVRCYAAEELMLDGEILGNGFNDPVAFG